jgi:hypothetical protein
VTKTIGPRGDDDLFRRVVDIIQGARGQVARSVNTAMVERIAPSRDGNELGRSPEFSSNLISFQDSAGTACQICRRAWQHQPAPSDLDALSRPHEGD